MKSRLLILLLGLLFTSIVRAQDNPPRDLEPITAENATQIEQVNILGYGLIYDLTWSPDGKKVAVASSTGVILYDAEKFDQAPYQRLDMPEPFTYSVVYSADGNYLATISTAKRLISQNTLMTIRIWHTASNTAAAEWTLELEPYVDVSLAFSPDGKILALNVNGNARLWDISNLHQIQDLPDQNWDDVLRQWYTRTNDLAFLRGYRFIAYSSDGRMVAGVDGNGTVTLWDITTGEKKFDFERDSTNVYALYFSPDSTLLVTRESTEFGGRVRIWDTQSGYALYNESRGPVTGIAINPKRPMVLIANSVSTVTQFDPTTGTSRLVLGYDREQWRNDVYSVAFSPDGNIVAAARMQQLELWDVATGVKRAFVNARDFIRRVAFSADGSLVAAAEVNGMVEIWEQDTLRQRAVIQNPGYSYDLAFSPDGQWLATYARGDDETAYTVVLLWSLSDVLKRRDSSIDEAAARIDTFNNGNVYNLSFTPDSKTLVVSGLGIELWNLADVLRQGSVSDREPKDVSYVSMLDATAAPFAITWDGTLLASIIGTAECNIAIWNLQTKTQKICMMGHTGQITSLHFSPDGKLLASGSSSAYLGDDSDNTVRIWDVETGQPLNVLTRHFEDVWQVAFGPTGNLLASASGGCYHCSGEGDSIDGTVRLWGVTGANSTQPPGG